MSRGKKAKKNQGINKGQQRSMGSGYVPPEVFKGMLAEMRDEYTPPYQTVVTKEKSEALQVADAFVSRVLSVTSLLLTIEEVCALLNVSRSTLHRLDKSGGLPGRVKLGGQVRYHRQVIEEWLLSQVEKPEA